MPTRTHTHACTRQSSEEHIHTHPQHTPRERGNKRGETASSFECIEYLVQIDIYMVPSSSSWLLPHTPHDNNNNTDNPLHKRDTYSSSVVGVRAALSHCLLHTHKPTGSTTLLLLLGAPGVVPLYIHTCVYTHIHIQRCETQKKEGRTNTTYSTPMGLCVPDIHVGVTNG